jgi:hypothetical protein
MPVSYSKKTKPPDSITWMNSKCTDNTNAHDDKSGTMTWVGWLKVNFKQKSKQTLKTYFLTAKD